MTAKNYAPEWSALAGVELYNRSADANENQNLASRPELAAVAKELQGRLHANWRGPGSR